MAPILVFEEGTYKGITVKFKNFLIIGSSDAANLKLNEENISPLHIAFIKGSDGFYITNLDENNYIYLNSEPIQSSHINNNDIITLAKDCSVRFTVEEGEVNEASPPHLHKKNKRRVNNIARKEITKQMNDTHKTEEKPSFLKKMFITIIWLFLIISMLTVSFISGIYVTDSILQIK